MESKVDSDGLEDKEHVNNQSRLPGTVSYIYRDDVVRSKNDGKIGLVTEVAGDSESDSSSDEEDEENEFSEGTCLIEDDNNELHETNTENTDNDDDEISRLPADHVRVLWMDDSETTQKLDDVTVIDRAFLHGG